MDDYTPSGTALRLLRTEAGLRQQDLGDMLGVTSQAFGQWEGGRGRIPAERWKAVEDVLALGSRQRRSDTIGYVLAIVWDEPPGYRAVFLRDERGRLIVIGDGSLALAAEATLAAFAK